MVDHSVWGLAPTAQIPCHHGLAEYEARTWNRAGQQPPLAIAA
jgi:hypothetical protein